jgi:hypothetical protein
LPRGINRTRYGDESSPVDASLDLSLLMVFLVLGELLLLQALKWELRDMFWRGGRDGLGWRGMWDDNLIDRPAYYLIFGYWYSAIFEGPNRRLCNKRSREDQGFGVRRFTQRSLRGLDLQRIIVSQHWECAIVHRQFLVQIHLNTLCIRGLFCQTSTLISHLAKID